MMAWRLKNKAAGEEAVGPAKTGRKEPPKGEDEDEETLGPASFSGAELRSARPPHSEDEGGNSLKLDYATNCVN